MILLLYLEAEAILATLLSKIFPGEHAPGPPRTYGHLVWPTKDGDCRLAESMNFIILRTMHIGCSEYEFDTIITNGAYRGTLAKRILANEHMYDTSMGRAQLMWPPKHDGCSEYEFNVKITNDAYRPTSIKWCFSTGHVTRTYLIRGESTLVLPKTYSGCREYEFNIT